MRPPAAALPTWRVIVVSVSLAWLGIPASGLALPGPQTEPQIISIPDGTLVPLYLMDDLSSKTSKPNDPVHFKVREDVRISGKVVIPWNSPGLGRVAIVGGRGLAGRVGSVNFTVDYVKAVDGTNIRVRGAPKLRGGSSTSVAAAAVAYGPAALLVMRGSHAEIRKGTMLSVYVNGEGKVTVAGPAPAAKATPGAAPQPAASRPVAPTAATGKPEVQQPGAPAAAGAEKAAAMPPPEGPKLHVMDPPVPDPSTPVEVTASPLNLQGAALDSRGVALVIVNGRQAEIRSSGDNKAVTFVAKGLTLQEGLNRIRIDATNVDGAATHLVISLWLRSSPRPLARRPLSKDEVIELVKAGVTSRRIADLVDDRGIDFAPTDDFLDVLRAAGGDEALVESMRSAKQPKP